MLPALLVIIVIKFEVIVTLVVARRGASHLHVTPGAHAWAQALPLCLYLLVFLDPWVLRK